MHRWWMDVWTKKGMEGFWMDQVIDPGWVDERSRLVFRWNQHGWMDGSVVIWMKSGWVMGHQFRGLSALEQVRVITGELF